MQRRYPIELDFEGLEMQKYNKSSDRAQRVDEKNGGICLVSMFTPGDMVIKSQSWLIYCIFCRWQQKTSHILGKIFKCM